MRPEVLRQLHDKHAEAARRSVDEHPFASRHIRPAQKVERARRAHEDGAGFLEGHGIGLTREESILRDARELRMGGEPVAARAVHGIARGEPRDTRTDGFNGARQIDTENRVSGSKPAQ